ncbi:hypothetical protein EJ05DRAFT_390222 [Pseudovirgaria hyperparasitica]|uniref:Uncharacterized protein n=1 Tax=Pseudovirgaria hyperparasitica TaxID=470096 RepID=A0A6A6W5Z9_9PEZI|nr:uncharacterized protein EJ05DRAFT_390222 [Pseudovirgaria hyperparasitica]KAF2757454.1 hypothetical protein EJ05DRAFT_390222 [Pseudovirgaria hyperparasitica]
MERLLPPLLRRQLPESNVFIRNFQPYIWLSILLRSLSLQIFNIPKHRQAKETGKVAIDQSRFKALIRSSIHFVPVGTSLYLIQLNWRSQFIVVESDWYDLLPFISKAHEILMQMSIAAMLATWVRNHLLQRHGLPFGGLVALFQATGPAYFFSSEHWGLACSPRKPGSAWTHCTYAEVVLYSVFMAFTVGPSSTVAMLPRAGRFSIVPDVPPHPNQAGSADDLFPRNLDVHHVPNNCSAYFQSGDEDTIDYYCSPNDFEAISTITNIAHNNEFTDGEISTDLGGAFVLRQLRVWVQSPGNSDSYSGFGHYVAELVNSLNHTFTRPLGASLVASTQNFRAADYLGRLSVYNMRAHGGSVDARKRIPVTFEFPSVKLPYATSQCYVTNFYTTDAGYVQFDDIEKVRIPNFQGDHFEYNITLKEFQHEAYSTNISHVRWFESPEELRNNISIIALISTPLTGAACAIKAAWGEGSMTTTSHNEAKIEGEIKRMTIQSSHIEERWRNHTTWPAEVITISPDFMQQFAPTKLNITDSVSMDLSRSLRIAAEARYSQALPEIWLSSIVVAGLSKIYSNSDLDALFNASGTSTEVYEIKAESYYAGRGWYLGNMIEKGSIFVLATYCALAILHTLYTFTTGISSNSWDSVAEVIALALNSKTPECLKSASAGIESSKTFRQPVGIRARHGKGLELVFLDEHHDDDDELESVQVDHKY